MEFTGTTLFPSASERSRRRSLILFPAPLQGHINPMLHLANILHSRGFNITIIHTNFNSPNTSNYPHFTFRTIDDGVVPNSRDMNLPSLVAKCVEPFCECLAQLLSENVAAGSEEELIQCLIVDALWSYTRVVRDKFELPLIVLWTGSMATALVENSFPLFQNKGYFDLASIGSQMEASIPEFPTLKFKDIPKILAYNPKAISAILSNMINEMKGVSGIIWNACKELEEPQVLNVNGK